MTQVWNNRKENDYTLYCDNCHSQEICEHEFGRGNDLESIDYCEDCCPKCEREREERARIDMIESIQEAYS